MCIGDDDDDDNDDDTMVMLSKLMVGSKVTPIRT